MLKRKKTEHIRGGVIRLKSPKNQFIANLEQENFIFRKMFCTFADAKLYPAIRKQVSNAAASRLLVNKKKQKQVKEENYDPFLRAQFYIFSYDD